MKVPIALPTLAALMMAGCSERPSNVAVADKAKPVTAPVVPQPPARLSRTTSLANCPVVESHPDEGGYRLSECPALGGYSLRRSESDGRETILVRPPGGAFHSLNLGEGTSGGFSRMGETVEWRGRVVDGVFRPDMIVLRHVVVDDPGDPHKETGYLLPVALAGGLPCVVQRIAPGPNQSAKARAVADSGPACPS